MELETQNETIEGVFNGIDMISEDGRVWPVPGNYSSKSKLQEGDKLKLVIGDDGSFIYKQIERLECKRVRATINWVKRDCFATVGKKKYRILYQTASFFHLRDDDVAVILIPLTREVSWAAVENVIKQQKDDEQEMEESV